MKKTLVMVVANLGWSALLVAVFVLFVLMCNDTQCLIVLFPGVFALVKNYVLEGIPQVQDAGGSRQRIGNDP